MSPGARLAYALALVAAIASAGAVAIGVLLGVAFAIDALGVWTAASDRLDAEDRG